MDYTPFIIGSTLSTIGMIILLIAGIILIVKNRSFPSILVFLGILLQAGISIFHFIGNIVTGSAGAEALAKFQGLMSILQGLGFFIFCVGMLILVITHFKKSTNI